MNPETLALKEQVLSGMDDDQRAEALDVIDRLAGAIRDACEIWGTLYVCAVLVGIGKKLSSARADA